ncbi:MAG: VanW family protein [Clostridia bacterium]|nr:VanW family protein [Clostridia bacterium]
MNKMDKPIARSNLRLKCGMLYYGTLRKLLWVTMARKFARTHSKEPLKHLCFSHKTLLRRQLKDVDMWLQENKIINLKLAVPKINGIIIRPGETFSYWRLIGKPSRRKGYVDGMILRNGKFYPGTGGGLCQLSNLIFWMAAHSPLTIVERHRHGYDVFPDSNRSQPFGSGATCYYPHGDLMLRNDTDNTYQIVLNVGKDYLEGEIRVSSPMMEKYRVIEKNHRMEPEYWGGYTRHNELYQEIYSLDGELLQTRPLVENHAVMMYSPFLDAPPTSYSNKN